MEETKEEVKEETRLRHYEMLYIIPVKYTVDELPGVQGKIKEIWAEYGCEVTYEEDLGKRKLSYPIQHTHHGYYYVIEFNLEADKLVKLNESLRLSSDVLRHLIVSKAERTAEEMAAEKDRQSRREEEEEQDLKRKIESRANPKGKAKIVTAKPADKPEEKPASSSATTSSKVSIEDLDKKLDELIDDSIL